MPLQIGVVGAGAIGLSVATWAARLGAAVTVIDREYPAAGSSGLSLGVFNRQTPDQHELELRIRSVAELERLEKEADLPLPRCGYVRLARREADLSRLRATLEAQRALGYTEARVLDPDGLCALVPDLRSDDLVGGLYGPSDGTFDGHLLCAALQSEAEDMNVELRVRTPLQGADLEGRRIALVTPDGKIECDRVVNAAGAWAPQVGAMLGVNCPVVAQRHAVCVAKIGRPIGYRMPTLNEYMPGSGDYALVLRPEGSDRLLAMLHSHEVVAGSPRVSADSYARGVSFDYVELVAERLASRLPGLADDLSLEGGWAGLYPISPDDRFQVGPYREDPRVIAAAGVGGVGITVSPAVGRLAAEWAVLENSNFISFAEELLPDRLSLADSPTSA